MVTPDGASQTTNGWRVVTLEEVADVRWGDTSTTKAAYTETGFFAYSASGQDGYLPYADFHHKGVVLSAIGANCGKTWLAKGEWSCIKNTIRFWSKDPTVDTEFLYWVTRNTEFWPKRGSAQPFIAQGDARTVNVTLPPLLDQQAIAHILGTLDDKIELNRRMNETLEEMARALFKSWFVNFDPVQAKMEARWRRGESLPGLSADLYDLFLDQLVDSELGEIPKGWEVVDLGEIVELAYGKALRALDRKDGPVPVYGSNGQVGWHDKKLVAGPGIIVGRKGNPGVVTWAHGDFFPIDTTFYVVPRDASRGLPFLYFALTGQDLPSVSVDSAVPGLNRNLAYMNKQLVPDEHVLAEFNNYVGMIFSRCQRLEEESRTLAAQRDGLLPGLVSGKLRLEHNPESGRNTA